MTVKQKTSSFDIYKKAWYSLSGKRMKMGLCWTLCVIIIFGCALLSAIGIGIIIDYLILPVLQVGFCIITLKQIRNQEFSFGDIWSGYGVMWTAALLTFVNSILISLWSLLFVVPGIIKSYDYALSFYVLADSPKMTQSQVREESCNLMDGNRFRLFLLSIPFYIVVGLLILLIICLSLCGETMLCFGEHLYIPVSLDFSYFLAITLRKQSFTMF